MQMPEERQEKAKDQQGGKEGIWQNKTVKTPKSGPAPLLCLFLY
jgi:hypothetical protein